MGTDAFKAKFSSIAKSGGGNWDLTGFTPTKMEKDGEEYTVVFEKDGEDVEVKFNASGDDIEGALTALQAGDFVVADFVDPDAPAEEMATKIAAAISMMLTTYMMF